TFLFLRAKLRWFSNHRVGSFVVKQASMQSVVREADSTLRGRAWRMACMLLALVFVGPADAAQSLPFTLTAPFVASADLALTDQDRAWLDQRKVLRVG
ncbi:Signal transduction histidine kinase, partial [Pseudomonas savastanoi pv. glycinea]